MSDLIEYYSRLDVWLRQYMMVISMAQIATLLVIFCNHINATVRLFVRPYSLPLRVFAFILLCTFGYGAITAFLTPLYADALGKLGMYLLFPAILISFSIIGMISEKGWNKS